MSSSSINKSLLYLILITWECICLPLAPCTWITPGAWPSPGLYLSQGLFRGGVGTSRVRLLPTGTGNMALKPPFSSLDYCSKVSGPEASSPVPWPLIVSSPPQFSLPVGIGGWQHRRLNMATPKAVNSDFPPWSPPWWVPPHV